MQQITDEKAAQLILSIIPRVQFQGNELQAVVALQNWAIAKTTPDAEDAQITMDLAPVPDVAAE